MSLVYAGFIGLVMVLILLDLGVFTRRAHVIAPREAMQRMAGWMGISIAFSGVVYLLYGRDLWGWSEIHPHKLTGAEAWLAYTQAYLTEQALSVDNMLVFAVILGYYRIPPEQQHRVLFWGIIGAVILRGAMIAAGAELVRQFAWIDYIFGAVLLWTAWKMLRQGDAEVDPERSALVRMVRKIYPVKAGLDGNRFFTRLDDGRMAMTSMFLALVVVDVFDVVFAVDSIPAAFGVTKDAFLVFTSNIFAILGLRSLYFALVGLLDRFRFLKTSLVILLAFIGVKLVLAAPPQHIVIPQIASFAIIVGILGSGVLASVVMPGARDERTEGRRDEGEAEG